MACDEVVYTTEAAMKRRLNATTSSMLCYVRFKMSENSLSAAFRQEPGNHMPSSAFKGCWKVLVVLSGSF